jgi:hypothetical protein
VVLGWSPQVNAISYTVWRSPVGGGGYVLAGTTSATTFTDQAAPAATQHYVMRAIDAAGNVSSASADVVAPAEPGPVPNAGPEPTAPPELPVIVVGIAVVAVGAAVLVAIVRRRALRAGR